MATTTHQVIIAIGIALYEILIVSLLDSCAPPSASINSFENRVMVDLEIYIPIEDKDHWYLMVMSLELKTIFHVDSNLPTERKEPRTESTNTLAVVLSRIISLAHFEICPFKHGDFSGGWSSQTVEVVHDVQPPPTCKKDSSLWVLS
ncbi:hypothetical protein Ahy_B08g091106 [Arachis hypogaea]|uniref:Ubiquitin-like protease family profile domain-containing protein n=1 Tax=Arachis hypogaea TaxID=3818 RepID=A0A444Y1E9_ARAHY|nr:hypothetical protein Ahy_B08g091106 [Arachis hypogaea]